MPASARRFRIRARRIHRAPTSQIPQTPANHRNRRDGNACNQHRIRSLRQPEPLKPRRQIRYPRALRRPAKPIAQRHHCRRRDHNRRNSHVRHKRAINRAHRQHPPEQHPIRPAPPACPSFEKNTGHNAYGNTRTRSPPEISICPVRIPPYSLPSAISSTGACWRENKSARFSPEK